eukprot:g13304.t1
MAESKKEVSERTWKSWMSSSLFFFGNGEFGQVARLPSPKYARLPTEDLVVKVYNGPLSRKGDPQAIMAEELETMKKLEELQVPFRGTVEATTTEWEHKRFDRKFPAMVMKSAGSTSVYDKLQSWSEAEAQDFLFQALTLAMLWGSKNVAHNDIKPHNMMVSDDGILSFVDFGGVMIGEADGRTLCPKEFNFARLDIITLADQFIGTTCAKPKRYSQDAFLANAYMVGAAFTCASELDRFSGVVKVQTGSDVSVRKRVCQQLMINDVTKRYDIMEWFLDPDFQLV